MNTPRIRFLIAITPFFGCFVACSSAALHLNGDGTNAAPSGDSGAVADESDERDASDSASNDGALTNEADSSIATDSSVVDTWAPPVPPVCDPNATWGAGTRLAASTASDDTLGAVTPDERTIAWTRAPGGAMEIDWADRASASDSFGAAQTFATSGAAADRVALSADGLRVVFVNADRKGFSEMTRATRADTFGAPSAGAFSNLNGALAPSESYGDPVIAPDDSTFYYSRWGSGDANTIYMAQRIFTTDPWAPGGLVAVPSDLLAQSGMRRRPTSVSSDLRTIFYFDETTGHERAAWYDATFSTFASFADLDTRAEAQPNAGCTRIYYSAEGSVTTDLFVSAN